MNTKIIAFGEIGKAIMERVIQHGFKPEDCILIHGYSACLNKSPAQTKILLEGTNFDEKYYYHTDDPVWGSRIILNQREVIEVACDKTDMAIIVTEADDRAEVGASAATAMLIKKETTVVVSILLKPLGNVMFTGADAIVEHSDTTVMIPLNQIMKTLPSSTRFLADIFNKGEEMASMIILEIVNGMSAENICSLSSKAFKSNGISYVGAGNMLSLQAAMERALHSPTFEYNALDRTVKILAYFSIHQESDMYDINDSLATIHRDLNNNIEFLPSVRIDNDSEFYRVMLLATRLS